MIASVDPVTGEHHPQRPAWTCSNCGRDWPCDPAREALAQEYGDQRVKLAVHMAVQLGHAAGELPQPDVRDLHERFIAWTR